MRKTTRIPNYIKINKNEADIFWRDLTANLKRKRLELDYSQKRVANRLGITQGAFSKIENNIRQIDILVFFRLAYLYEEDVFFFLPDWFNSKLQTVF